MEQRAAGSDPLCSGASVRRDSAACVCAADLFELEPGSGDVFELAGGNVEG